MASGLPPHHYLPVYAPPKIGKLMIKVGYKMKASGPFAMKKAGRVGKGGKAGKSSKGGKK